jgi:hypothetical protein
MATTTNFGWETPDDTDLVKDGAAAIRTALGGVDTSFVDLKGGTTGQVLSKASGTDLDFSWSTPSSPTFVGVILNSNLTFQPANNTITKIPFNLEIVDTNTFHDNSTNNTRITIPSGKAGKYLFTGAGYWDTNGTTFAVGERTGYLYKNNTQVGVFLQQKASANVYLGHVWSVILDLAEGDYVEFAVLQNSGASNLSFFVDNSTGGQFAAQYLGA